MGSVAKFLPEYERILTEFLSDIWIVEPVPVCVAPRFVHVVSFLIPRFVLCSFSESEEAKRRIRGGKEEDLTRQRGESEECVILKLLTRPKLAVQVIPSCLTIQVTDKKNITFRTIRKAFHSTAYHFNLVRSTCISSIFFKDSAKSTCMSRGIFLILAS